MMWLATIGGLVLGAALGFGVGYWIARRSLLAQAVSAVVTASQKEIDGAKADAAKSEAKARADAAALVDAIPGQTPEQVIAELEKLP